MDWLGDLIASFVLDDDDAVVARQMALAVTSGGAVGATAFLETCRRIGEGADDPEDLIKALDLLEEPDAVSRLGMLVIRCFAVVRIDYESRQAAQRARFQLSTVADDVYETVAGSFGADALSWIARLVGEAVQQVSAIAASKAPVVRVETGLSLPSSLLAFDLYGDPERGRELVLRNGLGTPLVMPTAFEALSE